MRLYLERGRVLPHGDSYRMEKYNQIIIHVTVPCDHICHYICRKQNVLIYHEIEVP
jgi:hypothetical protein